MGCITELLNSGAKRVNGNRGSFVEGGGIYKGYEYLVVLNGMGHRCGYVAINESHPLHKEEGYNGAVGELDMHGGCTFYERQMTQSECNDKWIGFDCGHAWDARDIEALKIVDPERAKVYEDMDEKYGSYDLDCEVRTKEYVEGECRKIIDQLTSQQQNNQSIGG